MFIKEIYLKGYKWIDVLGDIKEINITSMNIIQLLLGTNGSGKSSILQELTPFPAKKSDYNKGGKKIITINYNDNTYTLISDFSTSKGEHKFLLNDINLNISGLSTLQMDLCEEHFGYTQLIDDLTHCRYRIVDMDVAKRKSLLLSISPSTPNFIIELHKKSKSLLREYKNNLNLLYSRKSEIEEKLLEKDELNNLSKRYTELEKEQLRLSNEIYLLDNKIVEYNKQWEAAGPHRYIQDYHWNIDYIKKKIQDTRFRSKLEFPTFEYNEYINNNENTLVELRVTHQQQMEQYYNIQSELEEYKDIIRVNSDDTDVQKQKDLLIEQEKKLKSLEHWSKYPSIYPSKDTAFHLHRAEEIYNIINSYLPDTDDWTKIYNMDKVRDELEKVHERGQHLGFNKNNIIKEIEEDKKFLSKSLKGPIRIDTNCNECDYMSTLSSKIKEVEQRLIKNEKDLELIQLELSKVIKVRDNLRNEYSHLQLLKNTVMKICGYTSKTIWESNEETIISILNNDPKKWSHDLLTTIHAQEALRDISILQNSIIEINANIAAMQKVNDPSNQAILKIVDNKQTQLNNLKSSITTINDDILHIEDSIKEVVHLRDAHIELTDLVVEFDKWIEYNFLYHYISYLRDYIVVDYKKIKKEIDQEIYELTKIIKEQESLQSRYQEEILSLIEKIDKQQNLITYIEMGLSPESGMPHHHVLNFINAILENVNFVLSKIWSVPFRIDLLEDTEEVTCDFKARCNNKAAASLNKLSKSQKAAVNFAFYIALIYATKSDGYPIFIDEADEGFDKRHKELYLEWLKSYTDNQYSPQMWMVSHDAALYSGFLYKDITCLHKSNVIVPGDVNLYTKIVH